MMNEDLAEYFMEETNKKFDALSEDLKEIKRDVEKLLAFRILLLGMSAFVAACVSLVVEFLR